MPKISPVIFIAAHGAASDIGTTVTRVKDYNVVCLTSVGQSVQLTSHNLALGMLLRPGENGLHQQLDLIESLPSTCILSSDTQPWTLHEHTLRSADDLLSLPRALSPQNYRGTWFNNFTMSCTFVSNFFSDAPAMKVCGGRGLIKSSIDNADTVIEKNLHK